MDIEPSWILRNDAEMTASLLSCCSALQQATTLPDYASISSPALLPQQRELLWTKLNETLDPL
jgi:hypothetical protein